MRISRLRAVLQFFLLLAPVPPVFADGQCFLSALSDVKAQYAKRLEDRQSAHGHPVAQSDRQLDRLYRSAKERKTSFDQTLDRIGREVGVEVNKTDLKSLKRSSEKIDGKLLGDSTALTDIVRGTIVCDDMEQVRRVKQAIASEFGDYRFNDRFEHPKVNGYRDLQAVVLISPPGARPHWAEIQVQLRSLFVAKKEQGDAIYDRWRNLEERATRRPLTEAESAEIVALKAREKKLYDRAYLSTVQRDPAALPH